MATIYEDVVALREQMTQVQTDVNNLKTDVASMRPVQLKEGDNLNSLDEGVYYIPTAAIGNTLQNLPVTGNTGIVEVLKGGANGQKIQRFTPCLKNSLTIYEREFYGNAWGDWSASDLTDSGWKTLPLADGIEAYGGSVPQYRKIGKVVSIRGAVKNVLAPGPLAILPVGYRPTYSVPYVQNTSMRSTTCSMFARLIVGANGEIQVQAISDGAEYSADKWFPIHHTFLID